MRKIQKNQIMTKNKKSDFPFRPSIQKQDSLCTGTEIQKEKASHWQRVHWVSNPKKKFASTNIKIELAVT